MRIVAGKAKGRRIASVPGTTTRPVTDRAKTALFDTIRPDIQGIEMLDLFGGSGAVGIEALSQGANHCVFCELSSAAVATIHKNLSTCELQNQAEVRHTDAFKFLRNTSSSFDLIYVAPPQYKNLWVDAIHTIAERPQVLNPSGKIIVQIHPREYENLQLSFLRETDQRKYGSVLILFFEKSD